MSDRYEERHPAPIRAAGCVAPRHIRAIRGFGGVLKTALEPSNSVDFDEHEVATRASVVEVFAQAFEAVS